jgi:hypothetical protein
MKNLILTIITVLLLLNSFAQPCTTVKEYNRKRHKIDGSTYGHPYTMFDRHNGLTFVETIINIRVRIIKERLLPDSLDKPVYTAYKMVYNYAITPKPNDNGMPDDYSNLAVWAKFNAFVMLIGLDEKSSQFKVFLKQS